MQEQISVVVCKLIWQNMLAYQSPTIPANTLMLNCCWCLCSLLSVITHRLNIYGHFLLFLYVEFVPKVCPHLSVTSYIQVLKRAAVKTTYIVLVGPTWREKSPTLLPDTAIKKDGKPHHSITFMQRCIDGARGSVVGGGTMLQTGRSPVQIPDKVDFSILPTALWPWGRLSL
jgi:hypothetical protein